MLGVDLETWFALHYEGPEVLKVVTHTIEHELDLERVEEALNAEDDAKESETETETQRITLDELTYRRYETLVDIWEESIGERP